MQYQHSLFKKATGELKMTLTSKDIAVAIKMEAKDLVT